jgi:hypothetical protein
LADNAYPVVSKVARLLKSYKDNRVLVLVELVELVELVRLDYCHPRQFKAHTG